MLNNMQPPLCTVILTALPVEYLAARAHLTNLTSEVHPEGTIYERGIFSSRQSSWTVGLVEIGMGNVNAAFEAERAIHYFQPVLIMFVGIAGGIKDVHIGDVVVNTKIYGYEAGKQGVNFETRPEVGQATYRLEQRARFEARRQDWLQRIQEPLFSEQTPQVIVAPIATGEKVLTSTHSELYAFLRTHYNDAVAVEMEGLGMLKAAHANPSVEALVIRGISDLIEGKNTPGADNKQILAAQHASAFAFALLANLGTDPHFSQMRAQTAESQKSKLSDIQGTNGNVSHTTFNNKFHGSIGTLMQGDYNQAIINSQKKP